MTCPSNHEQPLSASCTLEEAARRRAGKLPSRNVLPARLLHDIDRALSVSLRSLALRLDQGVGGDNKAEIAAKKIQRIPRGAI